MITVPYTYPLPRMDECIDSLGGATVFTTLDCNSGYWQIPVHPEDQDKTTFTSHYGIYRFLRLPFGLRNAPATFQRAIDIILSGVKWKTCLVYLDDVIVLSGSRSAHLTHVAEVLTLLGNAGLSLKLKKCHLFSETVDYLGHVIRPGGLGVAEKNTAALKTAPLPRTQTELRSFLGLCNVYRRFVPRFSAIAAPINALLCKGTPPQLGPLPPTAVAAFAQLRNRLLTPPDLALPRAEGHLCLDTDTSDGQLGCCLLQDQPDGRPLPLGYWSRTLNSAEQNYSTTEKDCLAIVWAVTHLRPYLEGADFTVRTDHHALRRVMNLSDAQGRLARWRLRLAEFTFKVEYHPGVAHRAADAMSRLPHQAVPSDLFKRTFPSVRSLFPNLGNRSSLLPWRKRHQTRLRRSRSCISMTSLKDSVWTRWRDGGARLAYMTRRETTTKTAYLPDVHPPERSRSLFPMLSDVTVPMLSFCPSPGTAPT
jgi:hypothetical protein